MIKSQDFLRIIQNDKVTSFWLKQNTERMSHRDAQDALIDAEILLEYCKTRAAELGLAVS